MQALYSAHWLYGVPGHVTLCVPVQVWPVVRVPRAGERQLVIKSPAAGSDGISLVHQV